MDVTVRVKGQGKPTPVSEITRDLRGGKFVPPKDAIAWFKGVRVEDVDFSGTTFFKFLSEGTVFERCDFSRVRFAGRFLGALGLGPVSTFRDCRFAQADLRHTDPGLARFERCDFEGARIHEWRVEAAEFVDCRLGARISQSFFFGRPCGVWGRRVNPPRAINEFRGNDLSGATLIDTSFCLGIDISAQRWPDDPAYIRLDRIGERIRQAREVVARWPNDVEREDALLILRLYSTDGFEEQEELFARPADTRMTEGAIRLWDLLRTVL